MALSREAYQALEDIVGPENISEEPAILDTYTWNWMNELRTPDRSGFNIVRPEAILMPGNTEEVQAIVKACNRYGIKQKAFSTGWTPRANPSMKGVITLDLRRMNRILEIDEKNMVAVIEPYVICAQLMAEARKLGLNAPVSGAGVTCSPLAFCTAGSGAGPTSFLMGTGGELLLGAEWVMPDGDILRTGSLGSGLGWFCGEGPGPSLRGIFRGGGGANGALGVFTKCAIKLAPWPGPAPTAEGIVPAYRYSLPNNFKAYSVVFPSWQALADAYYKIYDSEVMYVGERELNKVGEDLAAGFWTLYNDPTKSLDHLEEFVNKPEIQKLADELRHYNFEIVLAGMTPRDIEYQEKVLDQILADTGGHKVTWPVAKMEGFIALRILNMPFKHDNYIIAGGRRGSPGGGGIPDEMIKGAPPAIERMRRHQETGLLVKAGGDAMKGKVGNVGGGGVSGFEMFCQYDLSDIDSVNATREFYEDLWKTPSLSQLDYRPVPIPEEWLKAALASSPQPAIYHWQWKIKQMLDPKDIGDPMTYQTLEKPPKE